MIAKGPTVLVASPSLGVQSVAELIALAKKKPGTIDYGSGGIGSTSHLSGEMLKHLAGIDIQHIPYKGTNDLMSDLLSGRVPLYFMSPLVARQQVSEGKVVALGITSPKRVQGWLDTPTMSETLPGFAVETWHPLVVQAATPQADRRQAVEARHRCGEVEGGFRPAAVAGLRAGGLVAERSRELHRRGDAALARDHQAGQRDGRVIGARRRRL